jgi:hypothetical protein
LEVIQADDQPDVDQKERRPELAWLADPQLVGNHLVSLGQGDRTDTTTGLPLRPLGKLGGKGGKIIVIVMKTVEQLLSQSPLLHTDQ